MVGFNLSRASRAYQVCTADALHPSAAKDIGLQMADDANQKQLLDRVQALVEAARKAGADAADAVVVRSRSHGVSVRLGKVEGTESAESDDMSLRVFVGRKVASVGATVHSDPTMLAERAVAMARVSPDDPYQGLVEKDRLAADFPEICGGAAATAGSGPG